MDRAWQVRQAGAKDEELLAGVLQSARWQHRHLDWSQPEELLRQQPFLLATEHGLPLAALACPPDPPGVAWIRLLAVASGYDLDSCWQLLWTRARSALSETDVELAAALCVPPWLPEILRSTGFDRVDSVIFLEWPLARPPEMPELKLSISPLLRTDLSAVAELDRSAFDPLWRHSQEALALALEESSFARVIRDREDILAYQISTRSAHGGHLARLAVAPEAQGQGLATALIIDVLRHFHAHQVARVTVNTQGSNTRGQALYERLGFHRTGQDFPVYQLEL